MGQNISGCTRMESDKELGLSSTIMDVYIMAIILII